MKKIILFTILIFSLIYSDQKAWIADAPGGLTGTAANWDPAAVPALPDTLTFNATHVGACTSDVADTFAGLNRLVGFTGLYIDNGKTIKVTEFFKDSTGGAVTRSGKLYYDGTTTFKMYPTGTATLTGWDSYFSERCSTNFKNNLTFDTLSIATKHNFLKGSLTVGNLLLNGDTLSILTSSAINFKPTKNITFTQGTSIIDGAGNLSFSLNISGGKFIIAGLDYDGTGNVTFNSQSGASSDTIVISGAVSIVNQSTSKILTLYKENGGGIGNMTFQNTIKTGRNCIVRTGNGTASNVFRLNLGSSDHLFGGGWLDTFNTGQCTTSTSGTPRDTIHGNWTAKSNQNFQVSGATFVVDTSAIVTLANKPFTGANLIFCPAAGLRDSITDSLGGWNKVVFESGVQKGLSSGGKIADSLIFRQPTVTDTSFCRLATNWSECLHYRNQSKAPCLFDSMMLNFPLGGTYDHDSAETIADLKIGAGKRLVSDLNDKRLTLNIPTDNNFSGTDGSPDTIEGTSANGDTIALPDTGLAEYLFVKNVVFLPALWCTTGCDTEGITTGVLLTGGADPGDTLRFDSLKNYSTRSDSGWIRDTIVIYGNKYTGIATWTLEDESGPETLTTVATADDSVSLIIKSGLDTGWYDFRIINATDTVTKLNALYVIGEPCLINVAAGTGGTTVPSGNQRQVCGSSINIEATANMGYRVVDWHRSANTVTIADSTLASTSCNRTDSAAGAVTVTANFSKVQYSLTVNEAGGGAGTGDTTGVDTNTTAAIGYSVASSDSEFVDWDSISGDLSFNGDSTAVTLRSNSVIRANFQEKAHSITVTELPDHKVFQALLNDTPSNSTSARANVTIKGTFVEPTLPCTVFAKILKYSNESLIQDYISIDTIPSGTNFSGILSVPKCNGLHWYKAVVRLGSVSNHFDTTTLKWGVGQDLVILGQSNSLGAGRMDKARDTATDYSGVYYHYNDDSVTGNARWRRCYDPTSYAYSSSAPRLVDSLSATFNCPIGVVNCSKMNTSIVTTDKTLSWGERNESDPFDTSYIYGKNFLSYVDSALGHTKPLALIFHQGETECNLMANALQWQIKFDTLISRIRIDTWSGLPVFVTQISRSSHNAALAVDSEWSVQRKNNYSVCRGAINKVYLGAMSYDCPLQEYWADSVHIDWMGHDSIGGRQARSIRQYYQTGTVTVPDTIINFTKGNDTLWVNCSKTLLDVDTIDGFQVFTNGALDTVTAWGTTAKKAFLVTKNYSSSADTVIMRYAFGASPFMVDILTDPNCHPLRTISGALILPHGQWITESGSSTFIFKMPIGCSNGPSIKTSSCLNRR